ncbi:hypothetical protein [Sinomonas terrae]|uniref:Uncharacterized protein n=1 Tax=Sinomonas terrae TaxID=2908838 RepID=A0ABS9U6R7_9MICC|nr:hypothetical protein [Sinomonas terrae]MCH6472393.1 hypothetical protein [Sinomonas terrae]
MCGVCGRAVVADPVFPEGRTTRGNLIAAQMIAGLCPPLAGRVKVAGLAAGFAVTASGGRQALCATVGEAWAAVFAAAPAALGLEDVPKELEARYPAVAERLLLQAVIAAGREAASSGPARTGSAPGRPLPPR